jgi:hypothetical protein
VGQEQDALAAVNGSSDERRRNDRLAAARWGDQQDATPAGRDLSLASPYDLRLIGAELRPSGRFSSRLVV